MQFLPDKCSQSDKRKKINGKQYEIFEAKKKK